MVDGKPAAAEIQIYPAGVNPHKVLDIVAVVEQLLPSLTCLRSRASFHGYKNQHGIIIIGLLKNGKWRAYKKASFHYLAYKRNRSSRV